MKSRSLHFLQLGLSILVMSTSGALGRFISFPVPTTIWSRCFIGGLALFVFLRATGSFAPIKAGKTRWMVIWSSVFLGLHWLTYFWALKLSSVAIGMLSLFTYPVMTAVIEPFTTNKKFDAKEILLASAAFVGVFFLVPSYDLGNSTTQGILMGLLSALLYSIRNIMVKNSITGYSGTVLMFYQLLIISILLLPVFFIYPIDDSIQILELEWLPILLLALVTTALGHTLLVRSFAHFSVTAVSIMTCLMPLLGIMQGYVFLDEEPTGRVLLGGSIILLSVVVESLRSIRKK